MSEKPGKRVTIIEVAKAASVSTATAGRVLGGYGYASQDIRERVQAAAASLGYRPNMLARGLITGRTQTIGVVAGDIESPFYASILRGISDIARAGGFGVIVANSDEMREREREAVNLLMAKQVDGLIVTPCDLKSATHMKEVAASGCPVVQIDRRVPSLRADSVTLDNVGAARDGVRLLIEAGHRRIAIVAELEQPIRGSLASFLDDGSPYGHDPGPLYPSWQRLLGYVLAHREAGVPVDLSLVGRAGAYSSAAASEATLRVLQGGSEPTALFSADGVMSSGVMDALATLSLNVPSDLSLLCFDDLDWMRFMRPGISAIAQPAAEMGRAAARLMLSRIAGEALPLQHLVLVPDLRLRGSVTAPEDRGSRTASSRSSKRERA